MSNTIGTPLQLAKAITTPDIWPGDTVYLRGGTYSGNWIATYSGQSGKPITIQAYPGERPIIDGNFIVQGSYLKFIGIEFTYTGYTTRISSMTSIPTDILGASFNNTGSNNEFYGCVFHDLFEVGAFGAGQQWHDCISYNLGWVGPDRPHGHAYYIHNNSVTALFKNCIGHDCFGMDFHAYNSDAVGLALMNFQDCVAFNSGVLTASNHDEGFLLGGESGTAATNSYVRCMDYNCAHGLRFYALGSTGTTLTDNYLPDGKTGTYTATSESGNYYGAAIGNQVFVAASTKITNRGNITIYNQAQSNSITVNVSSILSAGDSYRLRNAQDYFTDWQTGTVAGDGTISVNMQAINRTVAAPIQWTAPVTTFPDFGSFVLEAA